MKLLVLLLMILSTTATQTSYQISDLLNDLANIKALLQAASEDIKDLKKTQSAKDASSTETVDKLQIEHELLLNVIYGRLSEQQGLWSRIENYIISLKKTLDLSDDRKTEFLDEGCCPCVTTPVSNRTTLTVNQSTTALTKSSTTMLPTTSTTTPLPTTSTTTTIPKPYITDCSIHTRSGLARNGVYSINVQGLLETKAWCNQGFTVIQRRKFGDQLFNKRWNEYAAGFGKPESDHWMGLNHQHVLTHDRTCSLQVHLDVDQKAPGNAQICREKPADCDGQIKHVIGDDFRVSSQFDKFRIRITFNSTDFVKYTMKSYFSAYFNGNLFSARDKDLDKLSYNCVTAGATLDGAGGFWYHGCHPGLPNKKYQPWKCSRTNKICAYWTAFYLESTLLQFQCL